MGDFNNSRLELARKRRGLTKKALAQRAGISTRILTAYERDEKEPTPLTVTRLAEAVEFPVAFLCGPDTEEPNAETSSFRALSTLTARQRDQALGSAALALDLSRWIDSRFNLPVSDVPRMHEVDPETAAEEVRRQWGIGERPVANMIHLLEAHGVRVFSLVEECAEVDAFSFWHGQLPYVFLNTMKSGERRRMDAAHELGHLVLHHHGGPRGRRAELEAQAFGSAFLMPRASVLAKAPAGATLGQIHNAKRHWKVAAANLAYRIHKLGLLTDWQYRSLFIQMGQTGDRHQERDGIKPETSQVLAKIFQALRTEGMTKRRIAEALNISFDELNKIVFGLVLTPLEGSAAPTPEVKKRRPELRIV